MTQKRNGPIPRSYWVWPGQLLAGEYPGVSFAGGLYENLERLLAAGVTAFIDLTVENEYSLPPYAPLLPDETFAPGKSAAHHRISIPDREIPTPETMVRILDTIDNALTAGKTVYVHCFGGIGRTGTTVGCFLVRRGMSASEALEKIAVWRETIPGGRARSPETHAQRHMVLAWAEY